MSKHAQPTSRLPVGGVERATVEGWTFPARGPATGETLWDVPDAGVADVHVAAEAAWTAFHGTTWTTVTEMRRAAVESLREALAARADDLSLLLAAETGVPVTLRTAH